MNNLETYFSWPITGHEAIIKYLQNCLLNNKLNQAFLFWGPRHTGKSTVARYFSQAINCENLKKSPAPCQKCQNCRQFKKKLFADFYEINLTEAKQDIVIEQIKELQSQLKLKSLLLNYKIAVINDADKLNNVSANALLKTLEEPFSKTIIILIAEDINKILPTIISRCQVVKFNYLKEREVYDYLQKENWKRNEINFVVKLIHGQIGLALNDDFDEYLKKYDRYLTNFFKLVNLTEHQKIKKNEELLEKQESAETKEMVNAWMGLIRDCFLLKIDSQDKVINQKYLTELDLLQEKFSLEKIIRLLKVISKIPQQLRLNLNLKIIFENFILNL